MIKLMPLIMGLLYALGAYQFSAWRTKAELAKNSTPLNDPMLRPILARLAQALDVPRIHVNLYNIAPINGLAAPDGQIYLTRGFYEAYQIGRITAEQLASVVAHELGHVALGHTRRRMIDFSGQNALRILLGTVFGRLIPGVGPWLATMMMRLLAARLSHRDEYEADEYAAALMVKAGFGTQAQKSLLEALPALTGQARTMPAWLLSHPDIEDRVRAIETLEQKWGIAPQVLK